jgi:DNA repair protein RecN (Recombination protein N)
MLSRLVLRNFAIVEHLELELFDGLTVLTGETGSGKSILISALELVLGGRADTDIIRSGSDAAVVEALFDLTPAVGQRIRAKLSDHGIESGDDLLIRRVITRKGKNRVYIDDALSTVRTLGTIALELVDITSQLEHHSLRDSSTHVDVLDRFAGLEAERAAFVRAHESWIQTRDQLDELEASISDRLQRLDFLRYQVAEIDEARLQPGEHDEIKDQLLRWQSAGRIAEAVAFAIETTYEGHGSAGDLLADAAGRLTALRDVEPSLGALGDELDEARIRVEEAARELRRHAVDPPTAAELDRAERRIDEIRHLRRKYGGDEESVLATASALRDEIDTLENIEESTAALRGEHDARQRSLLARAQALSGARRAASSKLAAALEAELQQLQMGDTRLHIDVLPESPVTNDDLAARLNERGVDTIQFRAATNRGEDPKPIVRIASGGELSRLLLAFKCVLEGQDSIATYVFDEVDAGVGGRAADTVGEKLVVVAERHQVLCITHLPQIARRADHHYRVTKVLGEARTDVEVERLDDEERVEELARMLGGTRVTDTTRDAAEELLRTR